MNPPDDRTVDRWADHLDPEAVTAAEDLPAADRAALDRVAARLEDDALWSDPPAELRSRLLDRVAAERREAQEEAEVGPVPTGRATGRRRARWLLLTAAAAVLVVVGGLLWPRGPAVEFSLAGSALAPRASAQAELRPKSAGVAITLHITGLAPAPPGTYYAAWLRGPDGVVPVGSFHWRKGGIPIDLWSGVTADRYPELFVTLQSEGSGPGPSDQVVMDGSTRS